MIINIPNHFLKVEIHARPSSTTYHFISENPLLSCELFFRYNPEEGLEDEEEYLQSLLTCFKRLDENLVECKIQSDEFVKFLIECYNTSPKMKEMI